jgi:hypothetical protein
MKYSSNLSKIIQSSTKRRFMCGVSNAESIKYLREVQKEVSGSKVQIMETPRKRKSLRTVALSAERRIIWNMLQFCKEEKKNKGLFIFLKQK